jgi:hypothetical protein
MDECSLLLFRFFFWGGGRGGGKLDSRTVPPTAEVGCGKIRKFFGRWEPGRKLKAYNNYVGT